jgi:glutathione S-transferase
MTIALYYSPGSCSLAPHIALNEIGQPFELRKFATADRANYSAEYLAINPKGRIPALQIDGFILTENPAILAYLGRRFPSAGLYPVDGSEAEARCLELLAWSSKGRSGRWRICTRMQWMSFWHLLVHTSFVHSLNGWAPLRMRRPSARSTTRNSSADAQNSVLLLSART